MIVIDIHRRVWLDDQRSLRASADGGIELQHRRVGPVADNESARRLDIPHTGASGPVTVPRPSSVPAGPTTTVFPMLYDHDINAPARPGLSHGRSCTSVTATPCEIARASAVLPCAGRAELFAALGIPPYAWADACIGPVVESPVAVAAAFPAVAPAKIRRPTRNPLLPPVTARGHAHHARSRARRPLPSPCRRSCSAHCPCRR